ncbi:hypothetical protein HQ865_15730 [Mucilaginibacter mali]|uniref:DUF5683 domain-containing protein n=1 Tax=Mucilaginibacter mali TaxID=2740462 RepID=A0A7D4QCF8_9SPHI|nr:DUF5683 domain-containing protein [Mucilaginibacter mali]QKJ31144.1 hypothetical protein HQ865_15730 [Mucilaginibacter mali]
MRQYLIIISLLGIACFAAKAQTADSLTRKSKTDSVYRNQDTDPAKRFVPKAKKERVYHPDSTHSPRKAWTRSAFVPGWGQVYNHHWWKVPAIYAGLGSLGYAIVSNHQSYKDFLAVAKFQQQGKPYTDPMFDNDPNRDLYIRYGTISKEGIINAKDGYFRNFEISILGFIAVWGVNIVDAYIYGKLQHSYSMDNNFSFKVEPTIYQPVYASNFNTTFTPALKVTITLR